MIPKNLKVCTLSTIPPLTVTHFDDKGSFCKLKIIHLVFYRYMHSTRTSPATCLHACLSTLYNTAMPFWPDWITHYNDVVMSAITFQITSSSIVYSTVSSGTDQRKHQSSASLAFVRGIHLWPVNSPHKVPVTRKMFPFDDVIMG